MLNIDDKDLVSEAVRDIQQSDSITHVPEGKKHPNDNPLRETVKSKLQETKQIFKDMTKEKDNKFVVNSKIVDVMKEMWDAKRKRSAWKNEQ